MIKLSLLKVITMPIKSIQSILSNKDTKVANTRTVENFEKFIDSINIKRRKAKDIQCILLVPNTICYEIHEDGYVHVI